MLDKKIYKTEIVNKMPDKMDVNLHEDNRVNITLKEYEDMKNQIKELTEERNYLSETVHKIVKPFSDAKVPGEVVQGIFDNKFEAKVQVIEGMLEDPLFVKVALIVRVPKAR